MTGEISDRLVAEVVEAMDDERDRWQFSSSAFGFAVERFPDKHAMARFRAGALVETTRFCLERYPLSGGQAFALDAADKLIRAAQARAAIQAVKEHVE